jgi:hypothetical protein
MENTNERMIHAARMIFVSDCSLDSIFYISLLELSLKFKISSQLKYKFNSYTNFKHKDISNTGSLCTKALTAELIDLSA